MLCYVIYTVLNAHNVHQTGTIKYWYQYVCKIKWSHSCYDHCNGQHFTQFSNKAVKLSLSTHELPAHCDVIALIRSLIRVRQLV